MANVSNTGKFHILSGQTLAGYGSVTNSAAKGAVTIDSGGFLAPGNGSAIGVFSTGDTTLAGGTSATTGATFTALITGNAVATPTSGTDYDQLKMTGALIIGDNTLAGDSILNLDLTGYSNPVLGKNYFLILNAGTSAVTGRFKFGGVELLQGSTFTAGSYKFSISYTGNGDSGTFANDIVLTSVAVPEPATLTLIGLSAAGTLMRRRRANGV